MGKYDTDYWLKCLRDPGWVGRPLVNKQMAEHFEEMEVRDKSREGADHYGPYGANCMYTGQFDAGECWLCYAKRKKKECEDLKKAAFEVAVEKNHLLTLLESRPSITTEQVASHTYQPRYEDQVDNDAYVEWDKKVVEALK